METHAAVYASLMHCICRGALEQAEHQLSSPTAQQPSSPAALQVIVARKVFLGKIIEVFFGKIFEVFLGKIIEVFSFHDLSKYHGMFNDS